MKSVYNTHQRQELLSYLQDRAGEHVTAADICAYFKSCGKPIGTATVYRQLDKLIEEHLVNKYIIDEGSCACFEYVDPEAHHTSCFHCKCTCCGRLIHLECDELEMLQKHLSAHHHFQLDPYRTVFYGLCEDCALQQEEASN